MKINFIGIGLIRSGGMRVIFEYSNRLHRLGHDVIYYYPLIPYKFKDEKISLLAKKYVYNIKDVLTNKKKNFYNCEFKITAVNSISDLYIRNADVCIATTWPTAYSVIDLSQKKGKKIHYVQDYEIWNSSEVKVNRSFHLNLKKITISEYNRKLFLKKFSVNSEVITLGVYDIYHCKAKPLTSDKIITFIDHPLDSKGVMNAIEVVKKLKNKYNNLKFISFGHFKFHDIPDFVKFYENPDDNFVAEEIYGNTDIFIYPSLYEGFGMPPAEAMASKCAVVTSTAGAIPEFSVHMETAIHVEPNDVDGLFKGVCYLLENQNEMKRISENAYNNIRRKLNWDESVKKFIKSISS